MLQQASSLPENKLLLINMTLSFFALFLFFALGVAVIATTLGWIAVVRIRKSEGKLYGYRLAAFSALFFPTVLFLLMTSLLSVFAMRLELIFGLVVLFTLLTLCVKLFRALLRKVRGQEGAQEILGWKKNRFLYVGLAVLLVMSGTLLFLQQPREMGRSLVSESQDGKYEAEVTTWKRMRVFGADEVTYHFLLQDFGDEYDEPYIFEESSHSLAPLRKKPLFSDKGQIVWKDVSEAAVFYWAGKEVYRIETEPVKGSSSADS